MTATPPWYEGVDLTETFAAEIAEYSDPWAWIHARIQAGDFSGLHVGDYIPIAFTSPSSFTLAAQIAGINTYKNSGDSGNVVPDHIDFICRELWPTLHVMNKGDYNNGVPAFTPEGGTEIAAQEFPWLASDLYLFANSLSGYVPNAATKNPAMTDVDYTQGGIYYYLPDALKAVIITKRAYIPKRYSNSGLLTDDNAGGWANAGNLWVPSEREVYGIPDYGGAKHWSVQGVQYPIFAGNMNRIKTLNGTRKGWWLSNALSGDSTHFCAVAASGNGNYGSATSTLNAVPVCFRVA